MIRWAALANRVYRPRRPRLPTLSSMPQVPVSDGFLLPQKGFSQLSRVRKLSYNPRWYYCRFREKRATSIFRCCPFCFELVLPPPTLQVLAGKIGDIGSNNETSWGQPVVIKCLFDLRVFSK